MDKYEFNIKVEKMKKAMDRKDYATAVRVADGLGWERCTNAKVLMMVSQIYEQQERYQDARNALIMVYNRVPVSKRIIYTLAELAVKCGDVDDALALYKEYQSIAPSDPAKLILAYKISTARGDDLEKRISILEAYRRRDFEEKWAYELATLYQQAGRSSDCVSLCDEIILWFGVGPYVDKAMTLKVAYEPLTPEQEERRTNKDYYEQKLAEVVAQSTSIVRVSEEPNAEAVPAVPETSDEESADTWTVREDIAQDNPSVSPVAKEAELHLTLEQELAQAVQATSEDLSSETKANEWITDKPLSVDSVGEDVDGQYTLFRTPSEEIGEPHVPEHTRTFSFGALLTKTRRLDSLRDLAERNRKAESETEAAPEAPVVEETETVPEAPVVEETETVPEAPVGEETEAAPEAPVGEETETTEEAPRNLIFCHVLKLEEDVPATIQIKEAIRQAHEVSGIPSASIARIAVDALNRAGFNAALKKLAGRDLLVEHAGELTEKVLNRLMETIEDPPYTAVVLLADDAEGISSLYEKAPALFPLPSNVEDEPEEDLQDEFENKSEEELQEGSPENSPSDTMDISFDLEGFMKAEMESHKKFDEKPAAKSAPTVTNRSDDSLSLDDFAAAIFQYTMDNDCKFDSMAELALAAHIDRLERQGVALTRTLAEELANKFIDRADRWTFKCLFASRYDREGFLIIRESHIH